MTAVCTFAGGLFPSNSQCNATIFSDSGMPSTVIRLMTLAAIKASVFWGIDLPPPMYPHPELGCGC